MPRDNDSADEIPLHGTQHLLNDYDHLEPDPEYTGTIGEYLEDQKSFLEQRNQRYRELNHQVGGGRQGAKWRVKWKRNLARIDQIEQVRYELEERDKLDTLLRE